MESPQFLGPTLVTRQALAIRAFHSQHQDIILKPLDGMGGMGIFRVESDQLNVGSIIETLNQNGGTSVMVKENSYPKSVPAISASSSLGGDPYPSAWPASHKATKCVAIWVRGKGVSTTPECP